jgi:hypothetical protein
MALYKLGSEAKMNRTNVLNDRDSKQVSKFVMEEIYQSKECPTKFALPIPVPNPHHAYKEGDRFYFNFPEPWFNMPTLNKAVGLRRIATRPRAYDQHIEFYIMRDDTGSSVWNEQILIDIFVHVRPTDDIETAMSNICLTINRAIKTQVGKHPEYQLPEEWPSLYFIYDEDEYRADILWTTGDGFLRTKDFRIVLAGMNDEEWMYMFNLESFAWTTLNIDLVGAESTWIWCQYLNVWDRRELFIHASFVTYTSFQYLGRTGEFYTKPSKIYDFQNSASRLFYFQVSFDGMNTINLRHEYFIVELSLILDSRRYQSE